MSKYIYGMHEYNSEWAERVIDAGVEAWSVELTELSNDFSGRDFYYPSITPIVRLNWGYGSTGTIPLPKHYNEFAYRASEFVKNSNGIKRVHIGNELSLKWEWADNIMPTLDEYVELYNLTYNAIKNVNPDVMITFAPSAPWNPTFEGDWVDLIPKMCNAIGHNKIDFFAFHAYTKGYELSEFEILRPMNDPYQHRNFSFAVLWEYMNAIPKDMRYKEVHITETNGDEPWSHNNGRWVQTLYKTINDWNQNPDNQKILSASLFRWNPDDKWDLSKSETTKQDFYQALKAGYQHNYELKAPELEIKPKLPRAKRPYVNAELGLNLRASPNGKILDVLPHKTNLIIRLKRNGWYNVKVNNDSGLQGWVWGEYVLE